MNEKKAQSAKLQKLCAFLGAGFRFIAAPKSAAVSINALVQFILIRSCS
jgi:hypothetical protein